VSTPAPSAAPVVSATATPTATPEDEESGATAVYPSLLTLAILCASFFA